MTDTTREKQLEVALRGVVRWAERHEQWWMSDPGKGGIDVEEMVILLDGNRGVKIMSDQTTRNAVARQLEADADHFAENGLPDGDYLLGRLYDAIAEIDRLEAALKEQAP